MSCLYGSLARSGGTLAFVGSGSNSETNPCLRCPTRMPHSLRASESVLVKLAQARRPDAGLPTKGIPAGVVEARRGCWLGRFQVWPVVQRELRESARRSANRRLRLASAILGTLMIAVLVTTAGGPEAGLGSRLLGGIHTLLLVVILLVVAPLAADCIAREHREGTLGLLFLTPLNAGGIVAGKALAQGLRDFTLWLAVLPLLTLPFLAGGITWFDALSALSLEFCSALLCLAAGLLVSSVLRERHQTIPLAFCLGAVILLLFSQFVMVVLIVAWRGFAALKDLDWNFSMEGVRLFTGIWGGHGVNAWHDLARASPVLARTWLWLCWTNPIIAILVAYVTLRFAAARLRASWRERIPSPRRTNFLRRYCSPLFAGRFRSRMQRTRDLNPIAWLQQYSWKARANKWLLCLGFLLVGFTSDASLERDRDSIHLGLLLVLGGFYLFVAVSGFVEEKRNGALEMLLVTPLSPSQLILGRVWGLWQQFLPASLVIAFSYALSLWRPGIEDLDLVELERRVLMLACAFLTLPIFATYFALRVKSLLGAAALTVLATWLPTQFAGEAVLMFTDRPGLLFPLFLLLGYGAGALLACLMLRHSLSRRIYSF